jgi:hypothetical protein
MLGVHAVGYALLGGLGTALGPLLGVMLALDLPRFTWPGPHANPLRRRRWLWTGTLAWPGR